MTKVIFKIIDGDDVQAFFPELAGDSNPYTMLCYAHIGQHSAAHEGYVVQGRNANPREYRALLSELKRVGYDDLKVVYRFTRNDWRKRWQQVNRKVPA
ncbi:MAG: hypothetical protein NXH70_02160 [Hyphomonas sp.]|nr:hypothetical protein [Hyphomonas sp.]